MSPQTIIFIGRSGCGKGTQAKLVESYIHKNDPQKQPVFYVETGAQFREFIKTGTYTGELSKEIYDHVDRQPDFLAIWMWTHLLVENLTGKEHLIIDGAPRSLPEASVLLGALDFYKRNVHVVYIDVSRQWSERQLLARGREDDSTVAKIAKRLDWFERDVVPAINYLEKNPAYNFIRVNGEQSIDHVHGEILAGLKFF